MQRITALPVQVVGVSASGRGSVPWLSARLARLAEAAAEELSAYAAASLQVFWMSGGSPRAASQVSCNCDYAGAVDSAARALQFSMWTAGASMILLMFVIVTCDILFVHCASSRANMRASTVPYFFESLASYIRALALPMCTNIFQLDLLGVSCKMGISFQQVFKLQARESKRYTLILAHF